MQILFCHVVDSAYTERFMGSPNANWKNYAKASVLTRAINMKGKKFLLVHGTADGKSDQRAGHAEVMLRALSFLFHNILQITSTFHSPCS